MSARRSYCRAPDAARRRALARVAAFGVAGLGTVLGMRGANAAAAAVASGAASTAAGTTASAASKVPHRIVVMSWELGEMLLSLGVVPVGMSLPDWYRETIIDPPLPAGVADLGLLYQPNFEVLLALAPDLIVITAGHASAKPWFERIAPTLTLGLYRHAPDPYRALCGETSTLATRLARPERAAALIDAAARTTGEVRASLAAQPARRARPVLVAELVDDRHLRVYGRGSLFDEMLGQIGVVNAANAAHPRDGGRPWPTEGGYALVPLQRLVDAREASLLLVGPVTPALRDGLESNAIWQAVPAVRERRVTTLPVIAPYGGLVSMQRFVRAVNAALTLIEAGGGGVA
ncbi:ABC transporter substrate-binding protein [Paraburkholderia caffeinilytica]|uniref:ABC transporter substrate-binding protein n=1 Tax=Paraburkholderia caffeinilytica TaxID=1761016 RepID=UPI0038BC5ED1